MVKSYVLCLFLPPSTHLEYRFGYVLVHVFIHIALYLYFY